MNTDVPQPPLPSTLRRDVLSAYFASATRLGSWVVVSAMVYRRMGYDAFAMLALVRGTLAILNYTTLGLVPAMVHHLARATTPRPVLPVDEAAAPSEVLDYARPMRTPRGTDPTPLQRLYFSGLSMVTVLGVIAAVLITVYAAEFHHWLEIAPGFRDEIGDVVLFMGLGIVLRLWSDCSGAFLQTHGRIALDHLLLAVADIWWTVHTALVITDDWNHLPRVAMTFALSSLVLVVLRMTAVETVSRMLLANVRIAVDSSAMRAMLSMGLLVAAAQMADYLYAPIDLILINKLISAETVADYAPAIQVDAGLLLLVGGLAAVLLPKTALAHARNDRQLIRRYYLRGTLVSLGMLVVAAVAVWSAAQWLFTSWLGEYRDGTRMVLPWLLASTVIGGSSAVGRSILLGMGHVRAFTVSVLVAGVANVILSYAFVRYLDLGLLGIVLGTVLVVFARCAIWMPWYVMGKVREADPASQETHI